MSTDRNNPPPKTAQMQDTVHRRVYEIDGLEEHVVADSFIKPLLEGLPENVVQILYYSATEMLNNAIDHSEGKGISAEDDEFGFTRTRVPIFLADYAPDGLVSRSKAKRVVHRFGKFKEVILDFDRIESIGQSFADEIFRVFEKAHPEVHITVVNANENVERMIRRASNSNTDSDESRV